MKEKVFEGSLENLKEICQKIYKLLPESKIVLLQGDLAAGKTTFVSEFAKLLHVKSKVSSPTFSVMNEYEGKIKHFDIYQNGTDGFLQSGLLEELDDEGKFYFIEWADERLETILCQMGIDFLKINIIKLGDKRKYEVEVNAYTES